MSDHSKIMKSIRIEIVENGVIVTVKKGREVLGRKVFEGSFKETTEKWKRWYKTF